MSQLTFNINGSRVRAQHKMSLEDASSVDDYIAIMRVMRNKEVKPVEAYIEDYKRRCRPVAAPSEERLDVDRRRYTSSVCGSHAEDSTSADRKRRVEDELQKENTFHPVTTVKAKNIPSSSAWQERLHTEELRKRECHMAQKVQEREMAARQQEEEESKIAGIIHCKSKASNVLFEKLYKGR